MGVNLSRCSTNKMTPTYGWQDWGTPVGFLNIVPHKHFNNTQNLVEHMSTQENARFEFGNMQITSIIDPTSKLVEGFEDNSTINPLKNKDGKARKLTTVLFYFTTFVDKPYTPKEGAVAQRQMSPMVRRNMEAQMLKNGTKMKDYSVGRNTYIFALDKDLFEDYVGYSYEELIDGVEFEDGTTLTLADCVGMEADDFFVGEEWESHRVSVDEILHSEWSKLSPSLKAGYQEKQAGDEGPKLTKDGEQIYRRTELYPTAWEVEDSLIAHDEDLSANATEAVTAKSTAKKRTTTKRVPKAEKA